MDTPSTDQMTVEPTEGRAATRESTQAADHTEGSDAAFLAFVRHNGSLLRHLEVPEQLWNQLHWALHHGLPVEADDPWSRCSGGHADQTDCDSQYGNSTTSYGGAFTTVVQTDNPLAVDGKYSSPVSRRVVVAAKALRAAESIWVVAPALYTPSCARLLLQLSGDTALLVRFAEALDEQGDEEEEEEEEEGDEGHEQEEEEKGCGHQPKSFQEVLLERIRPRLMEVVSELELPPAPGLPPHKFKYLLPTALAQMRVSARPALAVAPFPHWGGPRGRDFAVALLVWPLRDVEAGEELTRCRLPLGLPDFSSYGFWEVSYKEAADTHEWYTEAGSMQRLLAALTRLAPPLPPPPAGGASGGGDPWVCRTALVAGCGNSELGYLMWEQAGYPAVDNVDYVAGVVRLMDEKYGMYGSALEAAAPAVAVAAYEVAAGHGVIPNGEEVMYGTTMQATVVFDADVSASGQQQEGMLTKCPEKQPQEGVYGSTAAAARLEGAKEEEAVIPIPLLTVLQQQGQQQQQQKQKHEGHQKEQHLRQEQVQEQCQGQGREEHQQQQHPQQKQQPGLRRAHGGAVLWLVGDLTNMDGTSDELYDMVVDKATLDALMCPPVACSGGVEGSGVGTKGGGGGKGNSSSGGGMGGAESSTASEGAQVHGKGGGGGSKWRTGAAQLAVVYKYLAEMCRVTRPTGRFLVMTLRPPDAIQQLLQDAASSAMAAAASDGSETSSTATFTVTAVAVSTTAAVAVATATTAATAAVAVTTAAAAAPTSTAATAAATPATSTAAAAAATPATPAAAATSGGRRWAIGHHEVFPGGRDGQELPTHLYVLTKEG